MWNLGDTIGNLGNKLGLPEFGISEALGGADVREYQAKTTPAPTTFNSGGISGLKPGGNVLGYNNWAFPSGTSGQASSPTTSGGGAVSGGVAGGGSAGSQSAPAFDGFSAQINEIFNSTMGFLNQAESNLRGQQPGIENEIAGQYSASKQNLTGERDISAGQIDTAQKGGEVRQEDALTGARRLYNELVTGGQQRFGGASSAGEAYSALAGRELMRNRESIVKNFNDFMGKVTEARTALQTRFQGAMANLEQQKNSAMQQAQRDFQDRMLQITQQKSQAAGQKAQMQLAALQDLRNQVHQINLAQVSNTNSVNQLKQQAEQELISATQSFAEQQKNAGGAGQQFNQNTTTNPNTAYGINSGAGANSSQYTGQIARDEEELPTGSISPFQKPDYF